MMSQVERCSVQLDADYPDEALARLQLIKPAQVLGLSLDEITELLAPRPQSKIACADLETRLRSKITEIDDKRAALSELRDSLKRLLCDCGAGQTGQQACSALVQHRH